MPSPLGATYSLHSLIWSYRSQVQQLLLCFNLNCTKTFGSKGESTADCFLREGEETERHTDTQGCVCVGGWGGGTNIERDRKGEKERLGGGEGRANYVKIVVNMSSLTWQRTTWQRCLWSLWFLILNQQAICVQIFGNLPQKHIHSFVCILAIMTIWSHIICWWSNCVIQTSVFFMWQFLYSLSSCRDTCSKQGPMSWSCWINGLANQLSALATSPRLRLTWLVMEIWWRKALAMCLKLLYQVTSQLIKNSL